jgi:histidinol-phosphate aminotransferase
MPYPRPNIDRLDPYAPGEQPSTGDVIKLNTNENPYSPADAVLDAIRSTDGEALRRYPPPLAQPFRKVAAATHGLDPSQVIATNGGDELLRLAITVFCAPGTSGGTSEVTSGVTFGITSGGGVGVAEPSYSLYPVLAAIHDTSVTRVPLNDDWSLPDEFAQRQLDAGARLIMVVNPHAPSGRLQPLEQLRAIAEALMHRAVLLIDEAYVDFADRDAVDLLDSRYGLDNVLLLRSLSKGYSLAGLRFGYGLGHANLIAAMDKARDSYNTDILSQRAAVAALGAREQARQGWRQVIAERSRVSGKLTDLGMAVAPSQSNFILVQTPRAKSIYESLKIQGIYVRYFDQERLRDKLRITIGTPAQNDALINAISAL